MRVVLDTNIIISALNFSGTEREVVELARAGECDLYLSPHILDEVYGALVRKFRWSDEMSESAVTLLRSSATVIDPVSNVSIVEGNDADNRVLACALDAQAKYLVTGDRRHLLPIQEYQRVKIVTSTQFLSVVLASHGE